MQEEPFSARDSLQVIQTMIEKSEENISDQSHYFLLWGWAAFIGFSGQYILKVILQNPYHIWWICAACFIITMAFNFKRSKVNKATTYTEDSIGNLWFGISIAFIVCCVIFTKVGWQNCYPFFMVLYGTGTFISGRLLRFKPFVLGGLASFILGAASVWVNNDLQILFGEGAILFSYIVPGHLLYNKYHRSKKIAQALNS
jgi:hypothetical protein